MERSEAQCQEFRGFDGGAGAMAVMGLAAPEVILEGSSPVVEASAGEMDARQAELSRGAIIQFSSGAIKNIIAS